MLDPTNPSPFLEGTKLQYAWDSTSLGAFKKCPRYYQYKILDGWQMKSDAIHLRWGSEFHTALENYDRSLAIGVKHDDAVHDTIRALFASIEDWDPDPKTKSEELKTKANLVRSVVWYLDHYEDDPAKTVALKNGKPAVEVSFSFGSGIFPDRFNQAMLEKTGEDMGYLLCGHLDRIVEFNEGLYVMDRKTTSTTPGTYYFEKYDVDNQMTLYTLAGQIILDSPVKGVIVDAVQVAAGFSRPVRGFTYRTPDHLDEWLDNTERWLAFAEKCVSEDFWPMNDTSCDKFGGCEFRRICSKAPGVRERWLEADFERKEPWNPLKPR